MINELRLILAYKLLGAVLKIAPKKKQEGLDIIQALASIKNRGPNNGCS